MKIKQRSYPHPVLSFFNDDYTDAEFDLKLKQENEGVNKSIYYEFVLTDDSLKKYIIEGKAAFILHIECGKTLFREYIEVPQSGTIPIEYDKLDGKVEITGFIYSKECISSLSSEKLHPDYKNHLISIESNNTLALTQDKSIVINRNNKCIGNPEDIFVIDCRKDKVDTIDVRDSETQIIIRMPEKVYKQYQLISDKEDNLNLCYLLMPAIVKILSEIRYSDGFIEEVKDNYWFVAIENCCRELGTELSERQFDPFEIAQNILQKPYLIGFKNLIKLYERDDNGKS